MIEQADLYERLHGYSPYNESVPWQISEQYYQSKGIMAWSNNASKIIPHKIGTNYQSALSLASLVKTYLEQYLPNNRVAILECGAGSGRFSRNFLLAAKTLEIIDRITLIVSDYSPRNLEEIAKHKILDDFKEGLEYQFKVLDIVNDIPKEENIIAIFLHYVLDALPLTILRKKETGEYEELYVSVSKRKDQIYDLIKNDFLQSRLVVEDQWQDYDWTSQSQLEQEFKEVFCEFHRNITKPKEIYYSYGALKALRNLLGVLGDRGFLLSTDIISGNKLRYVVVGNSIAHEVDNDFLLYCLQSQGYSGLVQNAQRKTSRLFVCKDQRSFDFYASTYDRIFNKDDFIIRYLELENSIEESLEHGVTDGVLEQLDELTKVSPHDAFTYKLYSKYYKLLGNEIESKVFIDKARSIDFWNDIS